MLRRPILGQFRVSVCLSSAPLLGTIREQPKLLAECTQHSTSAAHVSPSFLTSSQFLALWPASSSPPSGQDKSSAFVMIRTCPLRMRPKLGLPCSRHGAGPAFQTNSSLCSSALSVRAGDGCTRSSAEGVGGSSSRQRSSSLPLSLGAEGGTAWAVVAADARTVHFWADSGIRVGGRACF